MRKSLRVHQREQLVNAPSALINGTSGAAAALAMCSQLMIDLSNLAFPALLGIFAVAAAAVWTAGTRLSAYVDGIARKTGIGKALVGMLLLGGITSLPEVATVSTAAAAGNAPLAVNNLLGTSSINLILLAVADAMYGRIPLTAVAASEGTLMQGTLSIFLMVMAAMVITVGDAPFFTVGVGTIALALGAVAALWITSEFETRHVWEAVEKDSGFDLGEPKKRKVENWSLRRLVIATVISAVVILVGGFVLALSADGIVRQTGIASGIIGFLLVGLATSLPEISSVTAAIRLREYDMAVGDIFGTNLFNFSLIFLADVFYRGGPVLAEGGTFEMLGAMLAALLTSVYLIGLLERRERRVFGMGYDSVAAVLLFAAGLALLSQYAG